MAKLRKPNSSRKPPVPSSDHGQIHDWISKRVMPGLNPMVRKLDEMICEEHSGLQYAIKWQNAYYGLPELGWVIEIAAYDVSVNIVFLGGADFDVPPPLGESDRSRYIKLKTLEEAAAPEIRQWIRQAGRRPGWT
ncbi:DUF1801 domain-containing protein [Isoalcanivorax indicus]|uniref:DUF1801 domain-containing protein n=1 Tax=Isoalcanivorax indicus TaxID=2202653 RepID=UPI000DBA4C50|nr:DUF1801 domain-containing protein [Isoalcanivorax indicus]